MRQPAVEARFDPDLGPIPPCVILVTGVMAAGKSTAAQALAERLPRSVHVRGDTFRRFVVGGRVEPSPEMSSEAREQLLLRYQLAAATGDAYAQAGFVAIVQDIIIGGMLADVVRMFRTQNLFVVVLDSTIGGWHPRLRR